MGERESDSPAANSIYIYIYIYIYMAGRLSCDEAGQIRPRVLYRPCVAITVYGGAVRGCLPGTV